MKTIYFATTNKDKLREAKDILKLDIEGIKVEVEEYQSIDPIIVATKKARAYYKKLKKPIFAEDVSLVFKELGKLPGPFIKYFLNELGNDGLVKLLRTNRDAFAQVTIVFIDKSGKEHVFVGKISGTISRKPHGEGFGWDSVFIPRGMNKTFGEMSINEKNRISMRAIALKKFKNWLKRNNYI
jgi:non-canonical purine NTP pyrophosphatase (RdgB/HAM1 family)